VPGLNERLDHFFRGYKIFLVDGTSVLPEETPMSLAIRHGRPYRDVEAVFWRPDGSRFVANINIDPVYDTSGKLCGAINVFEDITDRKHSEHAAQQLAAIVESSDDAVISKNLDGIIASWNHGAEKIFDYSAVEIVGKHISMLIPEDRQNEEVEILGKIRKGQSLRHYETIRKCKDGKLIDISLTISPIRDASGKVVGASKIARDITERKRHERQQQALYDLVAAMNRAVELPEIYDAALDAIVCRPRFDFVA
jgi:PAS domain S-box-containing protein